jgi:hypothetical protein
MDEDLTDLAEALDAEPERRLGHRLPPARGGRPDEALWYTTMGQFASPIRRWQSVFGVDNVHVLVYDDFKANTAAVMRRVFRALDVDPNAPIRYDVVNGNKVTRSALAQRLLRNPPEWMDKTYQALTPQRWHGQFLKRLVRLNTRYEARPPMNEEVAARLRTVFAPEIEDLSRLIDRDLTGWCRDDGVLVH